METHNPASHDEAFRLFVALPVPLPVQEAIEQAQTSLRSALPADVARWTRREQFHLTLRFLGNVEAGRVQELTSKLRDACRPFNPITLQATGVGFFPERGFPRVLWVGLQERTGRLSKLFNAVQNATSAFSSEPVEGDFHAHITLARIKRMQKREAEQLKEAAAGLSGRVFGEWTVPEVLLMRSRLSPAGAEHWEVGRFELGGALRDA